MSSIVVIVVSFLLTMDMLLATKKLDFVTYEITRRTKTSRKFVVFL